MVFWYRNSILASIISIVGCVTVIVGIGAIRSGELGVGQAVLVIAVGVLLAIIGWWISDRKRKKQIEKARMEQNRKNQEISSQNSGNTSYPTGNATQNTRYTSGNASQNTGYTSGNASQKAGNTTPRSSTGAGTASRNDTRDKADPTADRASSAAGSTAYKKEDSSDYTSGTANKDKGSSASYSGTANKEEGPSVYTSDTAGDESQDQIRFCSKCGAGLVSGALFCSSCGVKIQPPKAKRQKDDAQKEEQSKQKLEDIFQKAGEYREKGDYQKELDILLTGLTIDEKNPVLLNDIGKAYQNTGDCHSALEYYLRSAEKDPDSLSIGSDIAGAYLSLGEYGQAQKFYEGEIGKLEKMNTPESENILSTAYANCALCAGKSGDFNKAREYLVKAEKAGNKECEEIWNQLLRA